VRCSELIPAPVTKSSIAYAQHKLSVIKTEIREKRFDYSRHFPDSPRAAVFAGLSTNDRNRTVGAGVQRWLQVHETGAAASTYKGYKHKSQHVTAKWDKVRIADVTKTDIKLFQSELLRKDLSPKTVNDIFTIVRGVWSDAFDDGVIQLNPLDRIRNVQRDEGDSADPFTRDELARIQKVKTRRQSDINMIMFACWTGLSVSELIALAWEDIDTERWTVRVQRSRVNTEYKVPKEKSRIRDVELVDEAINWIKRQKQRTYLLEPIEIRARQRDNITQKTEQVRFVFLNGASSQPWHASSVSRWFTSHLKRAGVRHRGPNQCRHTFASQCLSHFVPMEWLARQLGHTDTTMIKKHYGRWIPENTPSMAGLVSEMLGFRKKLDSSGPGSSAIGPELVQEDPEEMKKP